MTEELAAAQHTAIGAGRLSKHVLITGLQGGYTKKKGHTQLHGAATKSYTQAIDSGQYDEARRAVVVQSPRGLRERWWGIKSQTRQSESAAVPTRLIWWL